MSGIGEISERRNWLQKIIHRLIFCKTWKISFFAATWKMNCSKCGKRIRCYWDGHDIENHGIDICNSCAQKIFSAKGVDNPNE